MGNPLKLAPTVLSILSVSNFDKKSESGIQGGEVAWFFSTNLKTGDIDNTVAIFNHGH